MQTHLKKLFQKCNTDNLYLPFELNNLAVLQEVVDDFFK